MANRERRENTGRRQYDEEEDEPHVYCFVPGEGIDVVVLAQYLKRWVDGTATIQASKHPKDPERIGYTVGASSTLNREALEDLLNDTRQWQKESSSRDFRRNPYDYAESDTFQDRKKKGPTPGSTVLKLAKPRKATTTDAPQGRGATGAGRHDADKNENLPPYSAYARDSNRDNQQRGRGQDNQRGNNSPSPSPSPPRRPQPDPDSFRNLSITDDQNRPNQGAQVQRAAAGVGGRHAANTTTGTTKYVLKTPGNNASTTTEQAKKGGRHDENWH